MYSDFFKMFQRQVSLPSWLFCSLLTLQQQRLKNASGSIRWLLYSCFWTPSCVFILWAHRICSVVCMKQHLLLMWWRLSSLWVPLSLSFRVVFGLQRVVKKLSSICSLFQHCSVCSPWWVQATSWCSSSVLKWHLCLWHVCCLRYVSQELCRGCS